ncbi:M56 family metallopeptidase [Actinomadura rugatobispora]|uniref:M56 family metallopeptidase n=1 Tax=Actinomadura rugatobispora TaxID=1994 RepID=A0ABW0ZYE5_9ACTN|nr:hypothetical protein GCM10010200_091010 [Actinomadura rugatobispora]
MIEYTFLPAAIALLLGLVLGWAPLPLHPVWSARLAATTAVTAALATAGTLLFVTVNYAATLFPDAADRLPEWTLFGDDTPVPAPLGVPATVLTVLVALVVVRSAVRWTREVRTAREFSRSVLDTDLPIAVAIPGRHGGVLVSRGLLKVLDAGELQVVFRHELAHLRHRHHRYLAAGSLAAAVVPLLRPLDRRLRFATERWADEEAAEAVGDRALVARTIAKVALARPTSPAPLPSFTDSVVVQRVAALLATPPRKNPVSGPVILAGSGLTTGALAAAAFQLDHALASTFL